MTEKLDKYILDVQIDNETSEEHCTVLKTDGTTNMANWIEIFSAMYTHHSILEPLIDELNKNYKGYSDTEKYAIKLWKENEQLKHNNKMLSMKMSEVYTKYCLLNEFSEDTNSNDAVKRILSELMQITKEYR